MGTDLLTNAKYTVCTECQVIYTHLKTENLAHVENNYTWLPLHIHISCMQVADM